MKDGLNLADHRQLREMVTSAGDVKVAQPYLLAFLEASGNTDFINYPCRIDSYMGVLCPQGRIMVEVNLQQYEIDNTKLLIYLPGSMIRIIGTEKTADGSPAKVILVACSREYIESIRLELNKLYEEALSLIENPCLSIDEEDYKVLQGYYTLSSAIASSSLTGIEDAIRGVGLSLFTFIGALLKKNVYDARMRGNGYNARAKAIFDKFLSLVVEHHASERRVSFYAEQLCFTPKYLSQLVRRVSGKSAPEWIDAFVVLNAKNLLKFSNLSIKEIAWHLNFTNIPIFYKFFKTRTGMTPKEYRDM